MNCIVHTISNTNYTVVVNKIIHEHTCKFIQVHVHTSTENVYGYIPPRPNNIK